MDLCSDIDTIITILTRLIFIRVDYFNNLLCLYLQYRYQSAYFRIESLLKYTRIYIDKLTSFNRFHLSIPSDLLLQSDIVNL